MKRVVWKLFINFEKEEQWLNQMAAKGLNFLSYTFGRYTFEEGTPGEYIYRIELLKELPSHPESKAYMEFMEEAGVEYISAFMRWVYFRKKATDGPFDLYSNYESRIRHYMRVVTLAGILGAANLISALNNLHIGTSSRMVHSISYGNLYVSLLNFAVVLLILPMIISFISKIYRMKKEKQLYQ